MQNHTTMTDIHLSPLSISEDSNISIQRFQLLSIATKEGIWEYDFDTKKSFYNDGMSELFGYSEEEMADNESWWRNNLHPQDKKRVITEVDEVMESVKSVWWGKYQFRCKDGSYKLILDRLFVVRDKNQQALRLIGTMQDLTEIDSLQKELDKIRKNHHVNMMKAIFLAEENERMVISEELNENINQVLAAINMHLYQAKTNISQEGLVWLEEAQGLLKESMSGIRGVSKRLSPVLLKNFGFEVAIDDLLQQLKDRKKIDYTVVFEPHIPHIKDIDVQTVLFRIAQKQVVNIEKHTNATHVLVKIEGSGNKIKMTIEDNGDGINLKKIQYGRGFSNIQQKAEAFNGSFNLESIEGKPGFKLEVIIKPTKSTTS
jgi:PAS domain S-box-containing protein